MQTMLMRKLKLTVMGVLVMAALGAAGLASRLGEEARAQDTTTTARSGDGNKPLSELEALRRENRRLRKNIEILLDRISAHEVGRKGAAAGAKGAAPSPELAIPVNVIADVSTAETLVEVLSKTVVAPADPTQEAEAALKALREARDPSARRSATQALDQAIQRLRQHYVPDNATKKPGI
jgi:hypothetical protein